MRYFWVCDMSQVVRMGLACFGLHHALKADGCSNDQMSHFIWRGDIFKMNLLPSSILSIKTIVLLHRKCAYLSILLRPVAKLRLVNRFSVFSKPEVRKKHFEGAGIGPTSSCSTTYCTILATKCFLPMHIEKGLAYWTWTTECNLLPRDRTTALLVGRKFARAKSFTW